MYRLKKLEMRIDVIDKKTKKQEWRAEMKCMNGKEVKSLKSA